LLEALDPKVALLQIALPAKSGALMGCELATYNME
jgi:hypothetical protein